MAKKKAETRNPRVSQRSTRAKRLAPAPPPPLIVSSEELYARVANKAYELYQQRGEAPGCDVDDWLTAERLVREELLHGTGTDEIVTEQEGIHQ